MSILCHQTISLALYATFDAVENAREPAHVRPGRRTCLLRRFACILLLAQTCASHADGGAAGRYLDTSDGRDWPGYGRTFGQQHYSPLAQIDETNAARLGLAWSLDLGSGNSTTEPIAVDGVLYFAAGLSVVHAVDAASGMELWSFDPASAKSAGLNLRLSWGVRGLAWWNGKIYVGTADGRLIAVDAKSGKPLWSAQTFGRDFPARINGAPRVFDGKVIIGFAGTTGKARGFVTAYDAETGRRLWRFYTVPGDPAAGFENPALAKAAKTWSGEWWRFGGGGDVWNAITYDPETDTVFIGTGSGYPWNRRVRSADRGDNLFVASIVALDGKSGAYKWHYQVTPGDAWDYDATMDMALADLVIDGKPRKVLMQAPKNGFFYVLDRLTGRLISAEPFAKVTWASRIDLDSGRPVEAPNARYPGGTTADIRPCGIGAHSWMPMAYSPKTRLAYIPTVDCGGPWSDKTIDPRTWRPPADRAVLGAIDGDTDTAQAGIETGADSAAEVDGALLAWDPAAQKAAWKLPRPTHVNGGILATGGNVIFQGTIDGSFAAYSAQNGRRLWSFDTRAPLLATPITYSVGGRQYVTLLTGLGMGLAAEAGMLGNRLDRYHVDPRTQARRVLTFALDGRLTLPAAFLPAPPPQDPGFVADAGGAGRGEELYARHCLDCHGVALIAAIHAPDLRRSSVPLTADAFARVVRDGALVPQGMPSFPELSDRQLEDLREYIRTHAAELRQSASRAAAEPRP
jgi:quinohemoprotein ethanol dehydrogenase